jgi:hypothetical protein
MLNSLNNRNVVGRIFWDLEKAFDSLNHKIMNLIQLKYYLQSCRIKNNW